MPDALSVALAALFADPNIGRDAVYIAEALLQNGVVAERRSEA